jgi:hypothetical protein
VHPDTVPDGAKGRAMWLVRVMFAKTSDRASRHVFLQMANAPQTLRVRWMPIAHLTVFATNEWRASLGVLEMSGARRVRSVNDCDVAHHAQLPRTAKWEKNAKMTDIAGFQAAVIPVRIV